VNFTIMDEQEQWQLIYEIFDASFPRLGPGDDASTLKALDTLLAFGGQGENASRTQGTRVLDIGCGTGGQTLQLARHLDGTIAALDNHQPFLDELERRAKAEGLGEKIKPRLKDMAALGDEDGVFDLVWAEGSLYILGFKAGLESCFQRLVPGGLAAVSELVWLLPERPAECQQFFDAEYPAMLGLHANESLIEESGFELLDEFVLEDSCWWDDYYRPLEARIAAFRAKYAAAPDKLEMLDVLQTEVDMRRKYPECYGYAFYLLRRPL
jgi:cyclopropane fatty-acyl-phospholipid synthase-like methyltransferase